jgi:hypothetical protein
MGQSFRVLQGRQMKERIMALAWFAAMAAMAAFGSWVAVMVLDREPPFVYLPAESGSKITPNLVKRGQLVQMHWNVTPVKKDCPRYVQRFFYDRDTGELVNSLDRFGPERLAVGTKELNRSFVLPTKLAKHPSFAFQVCFECNLFQTAFPQCSMSPELPFDVEE